MCDPGAGLSCDPLPGAVVCNRLAKDGSDWTSMFAMYNSGTCTTHIHIHIHDVLVVVALASARESPSQIVVVVLLLMVVHA